ncbi:MAG: winged helix-turn-helix transcriptional regulator [Thermomicrobiales bacterium]|nr:winged helix-turn-helix transcriptional regulator [Thermomicrobiales bacterium]
MANDVFGAMSNPIRRQILVSLREGPSSVNDLASMFELGRPAISEHLQILRTVGLVREEPRGRQRFYHLVPEPLREIDQWLGLFQSVWRGRFDAMSDVLAEETRNAQPQQGE